MIRASPVTPILLTESEPDETGLVRIRRSEKRSLRRKNWSDDDDGVIDPLPPPLKPKLIPGQTDSTIVVPGGGMIARATVSLTDMQFSGRGRTHTFEVELLTSDRGRPGGLQLLFMPPNVSAHGAVADDDGPPLPWPMPQIFNQRSSRPPDLTR
jgi:hypothetical protein